METIYYILTIIAAPFAAIMIFGMAIGAAVKIYTSMVDSHSNIFLKLLAILLAIAGASLVAIIFLAAYFFWGDGKILYQFFT